ncbi:MAG: type II toxin-antitoxin system RelE/ParE family toxin [Prevotella sp.]|nr:type II toxin-antitoxin system RelE/ParE family toxin [Prevotella sp.]
MIIEFGQTYLEELYREGRCSGKKHRFQPQVIQKYQKRVDTLIAATCKEDLFPLRSLAFEALHGDKEGTFSVRVDIQYRLEFELREEGSKPVVTVCLLQELSNHYK